MGPNTKILTKRDRALIWTPFDSSRKNKQFKIKKVNLMSGLKSGIWPILGLKLATFFKISTLNLFCPAFTKRLIGKPNKKSIGPKHTSLASKKAHKWPYLNSGFFQSVHH